MFLNYQVVSREFCHVFRLNGWDKRYKIEKLTLQGKKGGGHHVVIIMDCGSSLTQGSQIDAANYA